MASYYGVEYRFTVALPSSAFSGKFQGNPTIVAGDFQR